MKITKLKLINFRNYEKLEVFFSARLNVIYGLNGVGKTNLVEAIYMLGLTKSFRAPLEKNVIKLGISKTTIEGDISKNDNSDKYQIILTNDSKNITINDTRIDKITNYISKINIILYNPKNNMIIVDAPSERRRLIDIELSQLYHEYIIILNSYNRILKQRNNYLKQMIINGNSRYEYLDILTKKLIEYGLLINKYRNSFINSINVYLNKIYVNIFDEGNLKVKYISDFNKKSMEELLTKYQHNYQKEINLGKTLFGIHHDDISFILDGNLVKEYGSEGQIKNSILSFKLAELNVFYEVKKEYPILILDDLCSELDNKKINNILKLLNNQVQTFITTTEIDNINNEFIKNSKLFKITNGIVEEDEL